MEGTFHFERFYELPYSMPSPNMIQFYIRRKEIKCMFPFEILFALYFRVQSISTPNLPSINCLKSLSPPDRRTCSSFTVNSLQKEALKCKFDIIYMHVYTKHLFIS